MSKEEGCFIGIDVAKRTLALGIYPSGEVWEIANEQKEITRLAKQLKKYAPTLIVLEATGGLARPVVGALAEVKLPVVVVNPRQTHNVAKATGQLAKTDGIDAVMLARFGEAVRPEPRPLKDAEAQRLDALMLRRRQ